MFLTHLRQVELELSSSCKTSAISSNCLSFMLKINNLTACLFYKTVCKFLKSKILKIERNRIKTKDEYKTYGKYILCSQ